MEIDKNLYKEIKEYCDLNGLKTKDYINALLKNAFMHDKYGDAPFKKDQIKVESVLFKTGEITLNGRVYPEDVVMEAVEKFCKNLEEGDKEFAGFIEHVGGQDKYDEIVNEVLFDDKKEEPLTDENNTETEKPTFEEQYPDLAERHRIYAEYPEKEKDPYAFEQRKKSTKRKIQPK